MQNDNFKGFIFFNLVANTMLLVSEAGTKLHMSRNMCNLLFKAQMTSHMPPHWEDVAVVGFM